MVLAVQDEKKRTVSTSHFWLRPDSGTRLALVRHWIQVVEDAFFQVPCAAHR